MEANQIAVMTPEQLKEFAETVRRTANPTATEKEQEAAKRYVFGLRGIAELFNVSLPTAQRYKNTFLQPAVMQRGRKIVTDATKAMELFNARI